MAWAQVNPDDFIDMLRLLKSFALGSINAHTAGGKWIDGTSGTVPTADRWTALTNGGSQPALPSSGSASDGELYLQGQGSSGTDQIVIGFKTYRNVGNNIFGFQISGYSSFDNTLTFTTMPGAQPTPVNVALSDSAFTAFFWVNARRIMAVARIGTTDICFYAGYILPYATVSQYPYPLYIAGSEIDVNQNYQQNNFGTSCFPDPCPNGSFLRWVDGSWLSIFNYLSNNANRQQAIGSQGTYGIWPLRDCSGSDGADASVTLNEQATFQQYLSTSAFISSAGISAYPLFPCVLHSGSQLIGQADSIYVIPGQGLAAGDTITVSSDTYDVFHNTWRTEFPDFFCVKRA